YAALGHSLHPRVASKANPAPLNPSRGILLLGGSVTLCEAEKLIVQYPRSAASVGGWLELAGFRQRPAGGAALPRTKALGPWQDWSARRWCLPPDRPLLGGSSWGRAEVRRRRATPPPRSRRHRRSRRRRAVAVDSCRPRLRRRRQADRSSPASYGR